MSEEAGAVAEVGTEQSPNIKSLLGSLTPEELKELKVALGVKKARAPKEQTPEYLEAKAELDAIKAEAPEFIARYEEAKEKLKGVKGTRVVLATKRYDFDPASETGEIKARETGEVVAIYGQEGWQKAMREAGFTSGQVAAVSKTVRTATAKAAAAG